MRDEYLVSLLVRLLGVGGDQDCILLKASFLVLDARLIVVAIAALRGSGLRVVLLLLLRWRVVIVVGSGGGSL